VIDELLVLQFSPLQWWMRPRSEF